MISKIINLIEYNILIVLSLFLLVALVIGKVDIITSILIYCMWFYFGFVSFQKGYSQIVDEEMTKYYRQKVDEEYNNIK